MTAGDETPVQIPDHAQAEARNGAANVVPTVEKLENVPDHAQAEARGKATAIVPTVERAPVPTEHATIENRGAPADQQNP